MKYIISISLLLAILACASNKALVVFDSTESKNLIKEDEKHFKSLKQLTFGGENAEAYLSFDDKNIIFQARRDGAKFDAIYTMTLDGKDQRQLSSGVGVTTCSYYLPDGKSYIYASTHDGQRELLKPDPAKGYMWPLYPDFDIFQADAKDGKIIKKLTTSDRYDAESTISPNGDKILFTSLRDGDMEIYIMDIDGSNQKRLTNLPGFDGGPFFSHDSKHIVWRGSHPTDTVAMNKMLDFQAQDLMTPVALDLYIMDADGSNIKRLTDNKAANFGPFFHPDNKRIIFSSNYGSKRGFGFDLWMINIDGSNLERITFDQTFNGFPMFTKNAKYLVFGSNRNNAKDSRDTNVFIAEWVE